MAEMRHKVIEWRRERKQLAEQAGQLLRDAGVNALSTEAEERFDAIHSYIGKLDARIDRAERQIVAEERLSQPQGAKVGLRSWGTADDPETGRRRDASGIEVARHTYFPFGEEVTDPNQDSEPMKFTGHERDRNGPGTADDLDYMHARYYSPGLCRFLSVDPAEVTRPKSPQSWNKYSYTRNSPMNFVDPDGEDLSLIFDFSEARGTLTERQQSNIMQNTRKIYVKAGVDNVRVFHQGASLPKVEGKHQVTVIEFKPSLGKSNELPILGITSQTEKTPLRKNYTSVASDGRTSTMTSGQHVVQLSNTAAHEAAHTMGLHPTDGLPWGSRGKVETVMEQGAFAQTLGSALRDFSPEDAKYLRELLAAATGSVSIEAPPASSSNQE